MMAWTGYICKKCGMATHYLTGHQFLCNHCGEVIDQDTATKVAAVINTGHPQGHCPFGGRCRDDCQWYMTDGRCAVKTIARNLDKIVERRH